MKANTTAALVILVAAAAAHALRGAGAVTCSPEGEAAPTWTCDETGGTVVAAGSVPGEDLACGAAEGTCRCAPQFLWSDDCSGCPSNCTGVGTCGGGGACACPAGYTVAQYGCELPDEHYRGCWPTAALDAELFTETYATSGTDPLTLAGCMALCRDRGLPYAGLYASGLIATRNGECWCASGYGSDVSAAANEGNCGACPDVATERCGLFGTGHAAVWDVREGAASPVGSACPDECSSHGACNATTGECACDPGFESANCGDRSCDSDCGGPLGQGSCDGATGACACSAGFAGSDCSLLACPGAPLECSGRGACNRTTTECECGYAVADPDCSGCPNNCSGIEGACDAGTGRCACPAGLGGEDCSVVIDELGCDLVTFTIKSRGTFYPFEYDGPGSAPPGGWPECADTCRAAGFPLAAFSLGDGAGALEPCYCMVTESEMRVRAAAETGVSVPVPSEATCTSQECYNGTVPCPTAGSRYARLAVVGDGCAAFSDCVSCGEAPAGCGWCESEGACLPGDSSGAFSDFAPGNTSACAAPAPASSAGWKYGSCCPAGTAGRGTDCAGCGAGEYAPAGASKCSKCAAGRVSATLNATSADACQLCGSGTYPESEGSGGTLCLGCAAGRFRRAEGALGADDCEVCGIGTFARLPASSACDKCAGGRYQEATESRDSAASCEPCPAGRFGTDEGAASVRVCLACPDGRAAAAPGQTSCEACAFGTWPDAASILCLECEGGDEFVVDVSTNATSCRECSAGRFRDEAAGDGVACADCAPGTTSFGGAARCTTCPLGRASAAGGRASLPDGSPACDECATDMFSAANGSACEPCVPPTHAVPGSARCSSCPPGTVFSSALAEGLGAGAAISDACRVCPALTQASGDACECEPGLLQQPLEGFGPDRPSLVRCVPCPSGGDCRLPGTTRETIVPLPDHWRRTSDSLTFYECPVEESCEASSETCNAGYLQNSTLCAVCADNFYFDTSRECVPCPAGSRTITVLVAAGTTLALLAAVAAYIANVGAGSGDDGDGPDASTDKQAADEAGAAEAEDELAPDAEENAATSPVRMLKILIGHVQVLGMIQSGLSEVPWPSSFRRFLTLMAVPNLSVLSVVPVSCAFEADFFSEVLFAMLVMPALAGITAVAALVAFVLRRGSSPARRRHLGDRAVYALSFLVFVTYPSVLTRLFQLYRCDDVGGTRYLVADFSIACEGARYDRWSSAGAVFLLAYGAAVPTLLFGYLFANRARLDEPRLLRRLGFVYADFSRQNRAFGLAELLYKVGLSACVVFLFADSASQIVVCMLVVQLYLFLSLFRQPYAGTDLLYSGVSLLVLFLTLLAGLMLKTDVTGEDGYSRSSFGYVLLAVNLSVLAALPLLFIGAVRDATSAVGSRLRRMLRRNGAKNGDQHGPDDVEAAPSAVEMVDAAEAAGAAGQH